MDAAVLSYLEQGRERRLGELSELLRFPSVSGLPQQAPAVRACAEWLASHLARIGLERTGLLATGGNPIVYGEWLGRPGAPTVLVYGHYDVQPSEPDELWSSPPFEPTLRDGRLYARGVTDNKGQIFAALAALESLLAVERGLPCNVRVLIEGEEELTAEHLSAFLAEHASSGLLAADVALITDSGMLDEGIPAIPIGLRGMAALQLCLRTAETDLHSGVYGGAVPNAVALLVKLLASLRDEASGRVLVEGFYDDVADIPESERRAWEGLPVDEAALGSELGLLAWQGEAGFSTRERTWGRPTLELCGIWGGYQGDGLKTVVPAEARAKISCRLVPAQDAERICDLVERHLRTRVPAAAALTLEWRLPGAWPILIPPDHWGLRAAQSAVREGFGREAALCRAGFSVPVVELVHRHLGLHSIMLGFTLPDENMHAPDEFIRLAVFERAVRTYAAFFTGIAA